MSSLSCAHASDSQKLALPCAVPSQIPDVPLRGLQHIRSRPIRPARTVKLPGLHQTDRRGERISNKEQRASPHLPKSLLPASFAALQARMKNTSDAENCNSRSKSGMTSQVSTVRVEPTYTVTCEVTQPTTTTGFHALLGGRMSRDSGANITESFPAFGDYINREPLLVHARVRTRTEIERVSVLQSAEGAHHAQHPRE